MLGHFHFHHAKYCNACVLVSLHRFNAIVCVPRSAISRSAISRSAISRSAFEVLVWVSMQQYADLVSGSW